MQSSRKAGTLVDDLADNRHSVDRYACVLSLAAAAGSAAEQQTSESDNPWATLRQHEEILHSAVEQGPYGRGVGAPTSVPIVGTELR